nr:zinc finger, CCHC-type [Tanacetum cinerariifolium]
KRAKWDNDDYVCRGLILDDFKHTLKYNKKELTLVELGSHLRIEESFRAQDSDKPKGNNDEALNKFKVFKTEVELQGSMISNSEDNPSTSGWVFLLDGGEISWASKKQTCITSLTMKSEFVALTAVGKEAEWLRNLILEIPLWSKPIAPISIRGDSVATLAKGL